MPNLRYWRMTKMFHVGDRVFSRLGGRVFYGHVLDVYEDFILVAWDSGVVSTLVPDNLEHVNTCEYQAN